VDRHIKISNYRKMLSSNQYLLKYIYLVLSVLSLEKGNIFYIYKVFILLSSIRCI